MALINNHYNDARLHLGTASLSNTH